MPKKESVNQELKLRLDHAITITLKGETDHYIVFEGGGQFTGKTRDGRPKSKSVIMGGNGTIYIAKEQVLHGATKYLIIPVEG